MRKLSLPDGLEVFSLNADETRFVHGEVRSVHGATCSTALSYTTAIVFSMWARTLDCLRFSFIAKRRNTRIYAFEPSPAACECLKANIELHGVDATLFECGLSNASGTAEFTFYPANSVRSGFFTLTPKPT